jgi:hypothetical protein
MKKENDEYKDCDSNLDAFVKGFHDGYRDISIAVLVFWIIVITGLFLIISNN